MTFGDLFKKMSVGSMYIIKYIDYTDTYAYVKFDNDHCLCGNNETIDDKEHDFTTIFLAGNSTLKISKIVDYYDEKLMKHRKFKKQMKGILK